MSVGMGRWKAAKIRSDDTWLEVRRAWEGGETGASLAQRYDVGLANLWRRRASEGWRRRLGPDPAPEPVEGWDSYAAKALERFEMRLEAERELALDIVRALQGGLMEAAPLWHLGFIYAQRAEHLGPETAAMDRERAADKPWAGAVWDREGRLRSMAAIDDRMLRLNRYVWRGEVGLPDGAAEGAP